MTEETTAPPRPGGKQAFERLERITKTPVSKAELEGRIAARTKPIVERHFTPSGTIEETVRRSLDAENERRIDFIQNRLARQKGNAKERFRMAR